jgi:hypothetical protein
MLGSSNRFLNSACGKESRCYFGSVLKTTFAVGFVAHGRNSVTLKRPQQAFWQPFFLGWHRCLGQIAPWKIGLPRLPKNAAHTIWHQQRLPFFGRSKTFKVDLKATFLGLKRAI